MAFNIETFYSQVNAHQGVMPTSRFQIIMSPPLVMQQAPGTTTVTRDISFWCQEVQFPGYQLLSHNIRRYTYGTNETRPFAPNFQPLQLTFIADNNGDIWDYFNSWTQHIMPHDTGSDGHTMTTQSVYGSPDNQHYAYELSYKREYVVPLTLNIYDPKVIERDSTGQVRSGQEASPIFQIEFREAFPSNLNAIQMAWQNQNEYATFTVFMEYLDWRVSTQRVTGNTGRKFIKK